MSNRKKETQRYENQDLAKKLRSLASNPKFSSKTTSSKDKKSQLKKLPKLSHTKKKVKLNPGSNLGRLFVYVLVGFLFLPMLFSLLFGGVGLEKISLSQMIKDVRDQKISRLEISGDNVKVYYKNKELPKETRKELGQELRAIFDTAGIDLTQTDIKVVDVGFVELLWEFVINIGPALLMLGFFFFLFKQARGGAGDMFGIGKSKAKLFVKGKQTVTFKDVGGMEEAKKELEEVVDFLKNPKKYQKVGARTPKGVLLMGPAGTGKTLLARAVAGEAEVQFLSIAGSEFMEMLVGVGASRVRDLFATAKKLAPSIIFIDEIDAIGRTRGIGGSIGGHDEREQTLNQILVEMDGFTPNDNVVVMAATNRSDVLDPALTRPGRFDRRVVVTLPDLEERKFILKIHAKNKPIAGDVDWDKVAKRTVGFSGADIENMLNEAAIAVARENREKITMEDIEEASLKVKLGPSKKRLKDEEERKMTAYHEAGHALVAHFSKHADPVHRISIISRGRALGYTLTPPEKDKLQTTKSELLDELAVLLGGRAAEILVFNELTAGASSDIERATRIARAMVMEYGMSDLGPMNFEPMYEFSRYGKGFGEPLKISDDLQKQVDKEIKKVIDQAQQQALELLKKHKVKLDKVAQKLIEVETLDGDEFKRLVDG